MVQVEILYLVILGFIAGLSCGALLTYLWLIKPLVGTIANMRRDGFVSPAPRRVPTERIPVPNET